MCKKKDKCEGIHPVKTCQAHSQLGKCPVPAACPYRHPIGVCHQWKNSGSCERGDSCRFCHPLHYFLGGRHRTKSPPQTRGHASSASRQASSQPMRINHQVQTPQLSSPPPPTGPMRAWHSIPTSPMYSVPPPPLPYQLMPSVEEWKRGIVRQPPNIQPNLTMSIPAQGQYQRQPWGPAFQ